LRNGDDDGGDDDGGDVVVDSANGAVDWRGAEIGCSGVV
jgi:hypothetical protein